MNYIFCNNIKVFIRHLFKFIFFNLVLNLFINLLLTGCQFNSSTNSDINSNSHTNNNYYLSDLDQSVSLSTVPTYTQIYNLYTQQDYTLEKFEHKDYIYSGIHLEQKTGSFINEFEEFTGINNNVYLNTMSITESFPLSWVLSCYANNKAPFITITPSNISNQDDLNLEDDLHGVQQNKDFYNKQVLLDRAKEFGNLNIPMFVNLYPLTTDIFNTLNLSKSNSQDYISFIQTASNYFNVYAPNVSLVWSIDYSRVYSAKDYYAGDNYINWVGLEIYEDINSQNNLEVMFNELDFFYNTFSNSKPIFINLAVSHFGDTSFTYNIGEKVDELNRFYITIPNIYSRLKMINYINLDMFKTSIPTKQNYLITDNKKILQTYTQNIQQDLFAPQFIAFNTSEVITHTKKADVIIYKVDDNFYVPTSSNLTNLFSINIDTSHIVPTIINNKQYFDFEQLLLNSGYLIIVDDINQKITIKQGI